MNKIESNTAMTCEVEARPTERRNWCYWQNGRDLVRVIRGWPEIGKPVATSEAIAVKRPVLRSFDVEHGSRNPNSRANLPRKRIL